MRPTSEIPTNERGITAPDQPANPGRRLFIKTGITSGALVAAEVALLPQAVLGAVRSPETHEDPTLALSQRLLKAHVYERRALEEAAAEFVPIKPGDVYRFGDQNKPNVHVTIHDLNSVREFRESLDIAARYPDVHFTYVPTAKNFVGGSSAAKERRRLARRAYEEGHRFVIHGFEHVDMTTLSLDQKANNIIRAHRALQNALGIVTKGKPYEDIGCVAPYGGGVIWGQYDSEVIQVAQLLNIGLPTWSRYGGGDRYDMTVADILAATTPLNNGDIVALHANGKRNDIPGALPGIVESGLDDGKIFKTLYAIPQDGTSL